MFMVSNVDPLVFHLQLFHDGNISGWTGQHDPHADASQRLCTLQQRG